MKVQFNNDARTFDCTEPIEQRMFRSGVSAGWVIMFHITADINSSDVDDLITPDGISKLAFTNDAGKVTTVAGYSAVSSCTIRHKDTGSTVEIQLTKMDTVKTTEEGGDANGKI